MKTNSVSISDKTLQLINRLQGEDEMAMIYAEEAESLIDMILEAQEQYSIITEKKRYIISMYYVPCQKIWLYLYNQ